MEFTLCMTQPVGMGVAERDSRDPLTLIRDLNKRVYDEFEYAKESTSVDSPIEDALNRGAGCARILPTL